MCVLYVSFGALPWVVQCCLFEVQIDLIFCRGLDCKLFCLDLVFCFVQAKTLCRYGCIYFLAALVLECVDVMVMSSAEQVGLV